ATFVFNPGVGLIRSADLGATHGRLAITDLAANVLTESSLEIAIEAGPETVLDLVTQKLLSMLEELGRPVADVFGVGVGLPGPVEHGPGRPMSPPIMPGWGRLAAPSYVPRPVEAPILLG